MTFKIVENSFLQSLNDFIQLNKNNLTLFEKNILENHGELKVKEEQTNILEQQTLEFNNLILIKVVLNSNATDLFEFDLTIPVVTGDESAENELRNT